MAATEMATMVGRNVASARKAAGMTQNELSRALNASGSMIVSNWETGKARPSDAYLIRLSEVLGHEPAWFYAEHTPERAAA